MKRVYAVIGLLIVGIGGTYLSFDASRLVPTGAASGSYTYDIFFSSAWWAIPIAAMLGVFAASYTAHLRPRPQIRNSKVLRHDAATFLQHWSVALGIAILIASGHHLGSIFMPKLTQEPQTVGFVLNLHFVGVLIFAFGICHYVVDLLFIRGTRELLPKSGDLKESITQYTSKLGIGQPPHPAKYSSIQKVAFPILVVLVLGISFTGLVKVAAYGWALPSGLMSATTSLHDVFGLLMIGILVIHIVTSVLVPWSWPLLASMFTGHISEAYALKNHPRWVEEMAREEAPTALATQGNGSAQERRN